MKFIAMVLVILMVKYSSSTELFTCDKGCQDEKDCPSNSHCVAVTQNSDCGLCLCKAGYKTEGTDCVPNKQSKNLKGNGGENGGKSEEITTSASETTTITVTDHFETSTSSAVVSTTQPGPTTQGPPPGPEPIKCAEWDCKPQIPTSDTDNPFTVRSQRFNETKGCKNRLQIPARSCHIKGGGVCYGAYCLTIENGNDYCICHYNRVDRQCVVNKPGSCASASGQLPPNAYRASNKRFRHKSSPDYGAIYGRHFAGSFEECVKLCQWSAGSCRSINFGTLAGQKICELLSPVVIKGSLLEPWLIDSPGWEHAQVV